MSGGREGWRTCAVFESEVGRERQEDCCTLASIRRLERNGRSATSGGEGLLLQDRRIQEQASRTHLQGNARVVREEMRQAGGGVEGKGVSLSLTPWLHSDGGGRPLTSFASPLLNPQREPLSSRCATCARALWRTSVRCASARGRERAPRAYR